MRGPRDAALTMTEAATELGVSRSSVKRYIHNGSLEVCKGKRGKRLLNVIPRESLNRFTMGQREPVEVSRSDRLRADTDRSTEPVHEPVHDRLTLAHSVRLFDLVERNQTALVAMGRLEAVEAERDRLREENRALRGELEEAGRQIRELERIPFVPQFVAVAGFLQQRLGFEPSKRLVRATARPDHCGPPPARAGPARTTRRA